MRWVNFRARRLGPKVGCSTSKASDESDESDGFDGEDREELDENFDADIRASAGYLERQHAGAANNHPLAHHIATFPDEAPFLSQGTFHDSFDDPLTRPHGAAHGTVPQGESESAADVDPPGRDSLNNSYVRIIHVNGVHHLALVTCTCLRGDDIHANLLSCRLVPTTFTRYRTLFTAGVLDDFRISNLECKVSAYQYYNKLRRLTSPAAPANVPSFYHLLLRLSRLWRWMKKLKWAGHGNKAADNNSQKSGELANFCPACPQPGINLPPNWRDDPTR